MQCPIFLSLSFSVGRMLREHELANVSPHAPFVIHHHLVWPDFPIGCAF